MKTKLFLGLLLSLIACTTKAQTLDFDNVYGIAKLGYASGSASDSDFSYLGTSYEFGGGVEIQPGLFVEATYTIVELEEEDREAFIDATAIGATALFRGTVSPTTTLKAGLGLDLWDSETYGPFFGGTLSTDDGMDLTFMAGLTFKLNDDLNFSVDAQSTTYPGSADDLNTFILSGGVEFLFK